MTTSPAVTRVIMVKSYSFDDELRKQEKSSSVSNSSKDVMSASDSAIDSEIHDQSEMSEGINYGNGKVNLAFSKQGSIDSSTLDQEVIKINVSGSIFEVQLETLKKIPNTRLSKLATNYHDDPHYRPDHDDFYFDRNPTAFSDILEYCRTGELHMDQSSCGAIFKKELAFWEIEKCEISMCCWSKYDSHRATAKMYEELDELFDDGTQSVTVPKSSTWMSRFHFYMFHTLENPSFSILARIFSIISMIITLCSIFMFVAETHYLFQQQRLSNGTLLPASPPEPPEAPCCCAALFDSLHITNHTADTSVNKTHNETELEHSLHDDAHRDSHVILHYMDFFTFGYFLFELLIRFIFAYNKKRFFKTTLNIVEIICLTAHFISIIEHSISIDAADDVHIQNLYLIFLLRSLRIMRVARIFKLFRHMTGFKVLVYTIVVSFYELLLIVSFLFAGVLVFASVIHYAEEETFPNIPYAIWWALVTMTTVGYGDVYPKTNMGYFIGSCCVIAGVLVIAFTVPVVVNNFTLYYALCKSRNARLKILGVTATRASTKRLNCFAKTSNYSLKSAHGSAVTNNHKY